MASEMTGSGTNIEVCRNKLHLWRACVWYSARQISPRIPQWHCIIFDIHEKPGGRSEGTISGHWKLLMRRQISYSAVTRQFGIVFEMVQRLAGLHA
jgi:hypothetical protein